MKIDSKLLDFIDVHAESDVYELLLKADNYPGIEVKLAVTSISSRKKIIQKVPAWSGVKSLIFPKAVTAEQASSQLTALYKQRFCDGNVTCDLTGGYGVDAYFLSQKSSRLHYFEADPDICEATRHNFTLLGAANIDFHNCSVERGVLKQEGLTEASLIYLDPARRSEESRRLYAISDYSPNVLNIKDELFDLSTRILIKVSPMLDITASLRIIPEIREVHVLSVNNECKELLFLLSKGYKNHIVKGGEDINIFTVNYTKAGQEEFSFLMNNEQGAIPEYAEEELRAYIYEPNSSIFKAGAFASIALKYNLLKISKHTHLYTSDKFIADFPGRKFRFIESYEYKKKHMITLSSKYHKANISTRNFPLTPEGLKRVLKISDGGDKFIFGCTMQGGKRVIVVCEKAD